MFAHRLGLIPLKVDPRKLDMKKRITGGEGWSGMEGCEWVLLAGSYGTDMRG